MLTVPDRRCIRQMQKCLDALEVPLVVVWNPDSTKSVKGEIKNGNLYIYDADEKQAWNTLAHEAIEHKLASVTRPYRLLVNSLIETLEKSVYAEKEKFVEGLPRMLETWRKWQATSCQR